MEKQIHEDPILRDEMIARYLARRLSVHAAEQFEGRARQQGCGR